MEHFGTTSRGEDVHRLTIEGGGLSVAFLTLGARIQSLTPSDVGYDLTLGSDKASDYEDEMGYHGALVGPVANRIAGARAEVDGREYRFDANEEGRTTLHGGEPGLHGRAWEVVAQEAASVTFAIDLKDGEGGFPGNRRIEAQYTAEGDGTLRLVVTGTTDAPTLMNIASHAYWNMDGTERWGGHTLRISADRCTPVDDANIPTGEVRRVESSPMDFLEARRPAPAYPPLDHNFCLSDAKVPLREVAWLTGASGTELVIATDQPGLQVFDGRFPAAHHPPYKAFALEPQHWPDAPHHDTFPSIRLDPGETYRQETTWTFRRP